MSVPLTEIQCCGGGSQCDKARKSNERQKGGSKNVSIPSGHVSVENPKDPEKQLLELVRGFSEAIGMKAVTVTFLSI